MRKRREALGGGRILSIFSSEEPAVVLHLRSRHRSPVGYNREAHHQLARQVTGGDCRAMMLAGEVPATKDFPLRQRISEETIEPQDSRVRTRLLLLGFSVSDLGRGTIMSIISMSLAGDKQRMWAWSQKISTTNGTSNLLSGTRTSRRLRKPRRIRQPGKEVLTGSR